MVSRVEFEAALLRVARADQKFAIFGALLARSTQLRGRLVIVGGSAITIYTDGVYVSGDVDVVGGKQRIIPVLRAWGFEHDGRYWSRPDLGLVVELLGPSYHGLPSGTTTFSTSYGPVRVAAPEDLLVRRLIYAKGEFGEKSRRALDEAVILYRLLGSRMDRSYLEHEIRYERVLAEYNEMIRRAQAVHDLISGPRAREGRVRSERRRRAVAR